MSAETTGSREHTRRVALQAVYQWLQADTEAGDLVLQFKRAGRLRQTDSAYFRRLVRGVLEDADALEAEYAGVLDRAPAQLDPVERAVLLLAVYELRECPDVPYRVVLDQATELAKRFGAQDGHRFVNGVLDKTARRLRAVEAGQRA